MSRPITPHPFFKHTAWARYGSAIEAAYPEPCPARDKHVRIQKAAFNLLRITFIGLFLGSVCALFLRDWIIVKNRDVGAILGLSFYGGAVLSYIVYYALCKLGMRYLPTPPLLGSCEEFSINR